MWRCNFCTFGAVEWFIVADVQTRENKDHLNIGAWWVNSDL